MPCNTCHNSPERCRCHFPSTSPDSPHLRRRSPLQLSQTLPSGDIPERPQQPGPSHLAQQGVLRCSPSRLPTRKRDLAQAEAPPLLQVPQAAERGTSNIVPRSRSQTAPIAIPGSPPVGIRDQPRRRQIARTEHVRPAAVTESYDHPTAQVEPLTGSCTSHGQGPPNRREPRHGSRRTALEAVGPRTLSTSLLSNRLQRVRARGERMEFWLEWHVKVGPRDPTDSKPNNDAFQRHIARLHNSVVPSCHPRLDEPQNPRGTGSPWNLRIEDFSLPQVDSLGKLKCILCKR